MTLAVSLKPAELEVSLFGPGVGECVVVHLGLGEWLVVDSCVDPVSRKPVALNYLSELHVDVGKAVKQVVAKHWHDDHTTLDHAPASPRSLSETGPSGFVTRGSG